MYCWILYDCIHTNKHILTCETCTKAHPPALQELKEKGRGRFSTDFSPSQSHSRWPQVYSNPSQSKVMMSSHFFHIWALICCRCVTQQEKQPALFTWELVSYSLKQAVRQPALFGSCWLKFFAVLVLWHLPSIRTIINYSRLQQCVPVTKRMCVWARAHVSVYLSVCGHDMLSSDLWGATFHPLLSQNLLFLSASWNMGSFLWIFAGHELDALLMDFVQLTYSKRSSEGSLGWEFLLTEAEHCFHFASSFHHQNCVLGYKPIPFCFLIFFCWFVKMPEANYLLSVSWGYIKVRCGLKLIN